MTSSCESRSLSRPLAAYCGKPLAGKCDTMRQQQLLAVLEELGGNKALPIPNSFPQLEQYKEFDYAFISPGINEAETLAQGRWTHGENLDGKGEFHVLKAQPCGDEKLGALAPKGHAQTE